MRWRRALEFRDVEIIDADLGASAAVAAKRREGFERLLGAVALGEVGLVLSCRVFCAQTGTSASWSSCVSCSEPSFNEAALKALIRAVMERNLAKVTPSKGRKRQAAKRGNRSR